MISYDSAVEKVIVSHELLQEENKLLLQEREYYYDQKLQTMEHEAKELEAKNYQL